MHWRVMLLVKRAWRILPFALLGHLVQGVQMPAAPGQQMTASPEQTSPEVINYGHQHVMATWIHSPGSSSDFAPDGASNNKAVRDDAITIDMKDGSVYRNNVKFEDVRWCSVRTENIPVPPGEDDEEAFKGKRCTQGDRWNSIELRKNVFLWASVDIKVNNQIITERVEAMFLLPKKHGDHYMKFKGTFKRSGEGPLAMKGDLAVECIRDARMLVFKGAEKYEKYIPTLVMLEEKKLKEKRMAEAQAAGVQDCQHEIMKLRRERERIYTEIANCDHRAANHGFPEREGPTIFQHARGTTPEELYLDAKLVEDSDDAEEQVKKPKAAKKRKMKAKKKKKQA